MVQNRTLTLVQRVEPSHMSVVQEATVTLVVLPLLVAVAAGTVDVQLALGTVLALSLDTVQEQ